MGIAAVINGFMSDETTILNLNKKFWSKQEWKTICKVFGANPKKCYKIEVRMRDCVISESEKEEE